MENVVSEKCEKCERLPTFNFKGKKKGARCLLHKEDDMVDVRHPSCLKCTKRPTYNFKEKHRGVLCKEHKEDGMVDVENAECELCEKQPCYNVLGIKRPRFCFEHKETNMVNVRMKPCIEGECIIEPTFNHVGQKPAYCFNHKKEGMIDVKHDKCEKCSIRPNFNFSGEKKGRFCAAHASEKMVDVCRTFCEVCNDVRGNVKYDNLCYRCFIYTFPDSSILFNHKTKERTVADFIRFSFKNIEWVFDKSIFGGCSRRRPDIFADMGHFNLILEIDENQHDKYDCSCENKRLAEMFLDGGSLPIVFIRFNPDDYVTAHQKRVPSCWSTTIDRGLCKVQTKQEKAWNDRLKTLKTVVESIIQLGPTKEIDVHHLFYDGYAL
jgi:hypothetical protein